MKTRTAYKSKPIDTTYLRCKEHDGYVQIDTSHGGLLVPRLRKDDEKKMKEAGWHLLREEYYNTENVDVLVLRFYEGPLGMEMKSFEDMTVDTETGWWHFRCGEMIPPYNWNGHPYIKATDYVVGWRPHIQKTEKGN